MLEVQEIQVTPFRKLRKKNLRQVKTVLDPTLPGKLIALYKKKINLPEEPELPFDKWIMPPQPQGYLKCYRYEWF
jgi:hypothetical protein